MGGGMGSMMSGSMTFVWAVVAAVVIALTFAATIWLMRASTRRARSALPGTEPLAELDLRYARGDLASDEYLQRRSDLEYSRDTDSAVRRSRRT